MSGSRRRWLTGGGILLAAAVVPALLPTIHRHNPAPYVDAVRASARLPLTPATAAVAEPLLVQGARIVDASGVRGPTSIRLQDGRIAAIGDDLSADGAAVLNATGLTVIPGLVDAHVHLSLTPGGMLRGDDAATSRQLRLHHLRAYLASGITTIFDPAVETEVMVDIQRHLSAGHPGPRYLGVGTPLATPGGYVESLFPPGIHRPEEVGPHLDKLKAAGAVGVKVTFEPGFAGPVWRLHPPEMEQAVMVEAARRSLPIYAHAEQTPMVRRALTVKPHALVHGPMEGDAALAAEIAAAGIPVITTLALFDAGRALSHPEQLEEEHIRRVVPAAILSTMRNREQVVAHAFGLYTEVTPYVPGLYRDLMAWMAPTRLGLMMQDLTVDRMGRTAMAAIRYLRDANVPLVMGSDSGNWPLFPYYFHGPTSWRELRMLANAGLSPAEILRAATVNPARMLNLQDEQGTVEVGKVADLVLVREDPLTDLERALRTLTHTVRAGVARTPQEWMDAP